MLITSIVMAPKKAVVASRRSVRTVGRKPKASSDSQNTDMLSASTEIVVGSAKKSTNKSSLVGTGSKEPRVVRRSKTTEECDEHTVASETVSESGRSTVVTSEGRENAARRSDIGGREAAGMTIEDSANNTDSTNPRERMVREANTTRLNLAPTDENRPGDRQGLTSSPAETAYFVRERAERDHRSDLMAYRRRALTCPEEAEEVWPTNQGGCVSIHARKPYSRDHPTRSPSVDVRHPRERRHPTRSPSVEVCRIRVNDAIRYGRHPSTCAIRVNGAIRHGRHPSKYAGRVNDAIRHGRHPSTYAIRVNGAIRHGRHPSKYAGRIGDLQ